MESVLKHVIKTGERTYIRYVFELAGEKRKKIGYAYKVGNNVKLVVHRVANESAQKKTVWGIMEKNNINTKYMTDELAKYLQDFDYRSDAYMRISKHIPKY